MSTITQDQTQNFTIAANEPFATISGGFKAWMRQRQTIARITRELNTYTERQLADLGLSRSDIPDVARGRLSR